MGDTGDILDDIEQTQDDIESTRHVIISHLIGWNLLDFKGLLEQQNHSGE